MSLTFDDGFLDFYTHAFPILQELALPAILFVTTGFVDGEQVSPLLAAPHIPVEPVTWSMLEVMQRSGLVELGAHTHSHPLLERSAPDEVERELSLPIALFEDRLGVRPHHFAYPRGLSNPKLEAHVRRHYASAVVGGGHAASVGTLNPYAIPRVPIRRSDGWRFFKAKLRGWLRHEEPFYARIHRAWQMVARLLPTLAQ